MSVLGGRIKYLREKRGFFQKEVADKAGLTVVQWSRYETNDRKPEPETLATIANVLETTTDYLVGRTNDWRDNKKSDVIAAEQEVLLVGQIRELAEETGLSLTDPRFQNIFSAAIDVVKRVAKQNIN